MDRLDAALIAYAASVALLVLGQFARVRAWDPPWMDPPTLPPVLLGVAVASMLMGLWLTLAPQAERSP